MKPVCIIVLRQTAQFDIRVAGGQRWCGMHMATTNTHRTCFALKNNYNCKNYLYCVSTECKALIT